MSTMISPVVTIEQGMMNKKWIKKKIWVGSVVKENVGDIKENTREGRIRKMRNEVAGCVQTVIGKKKLSVQLIYGQKKDMSSCLLVYLCSNEEVEMDDPISNLPKKEKNELLTIYEYPDFE